MAIEKSVLADVIKAHWDSLKRQSTTIPELEKDGEPVKVYFDPLSLSDRDALNVFKGGEAVAELVIKKVVDGEGNKLFSKADKFMLQNESGGWVDRLANRINAADSIPVKLLGEL